MLETVIKRDRDLGTPARVSEKTVTLTIDGQEITVAEGTSLMRAAAEAGINIPKLCATDSLEPFGSCRLCLVQIEGRRGYPASCTTPAENGMVVFTETPKLHDLRRGVMSINHNHKGGRKFQSAWFRIEGTAGAMMVKLGVCFDYPNGEADELWFCSDGAEWRQVPLTGSWFIEAFMGPMRNLQRYDAGEDAHLFSGVEDAFHTMALVEACFTSMALPAVPLAQD